MSFLEGLIKGALQEAARPYIADLGAAIARARVDRGVWIIRQLQSEHPEFYFLIRSLVAGEPHEAVEAIAAFWPAIKNYSHADRVVGEIQRQLKEAQFQR